MTLVSIFAHNDSFDPCRRALERLREEYKADSESLAHSEAISIMR